LSSNLKGDSLRIKGAIKGDKPTVLLGVRSRKPRFIGRIQFLVDTGSDVTGISMKDFLNLRIPLESLGKPVSGIHGLAGKVQRWKIENVELYALTEDDKLMKFKSMPIYVFKSEMYCPSLLGRDFLILNNLKLFYDPNKKILYLED